MYSATGKLLRNMVEKVGRNSICCCVFFLISSLVFPLISYVIYLDMQLSLIIDVSEATRMMITLQCGRIKQTLLTEKHTGKSVQYSFTAEQKGVKT